MPSVVLLARPTRPRWRTPVAILFVLATVLGGAVDVTGSAGAAPPDHANKGGGSTTDDGTDKCHPKKGCPETSDTTADSVAPGIVIQAPASETTVSGAVTVSGTSSDDVEVASVEVAVDGGSFTAASGTASWSHDLDTSGWAAGDHVIVARATDTSGNAQDDSVTVIVEAAGTVVPTVSITAPTGGTTVSGVFDVTGSSDDDVEVAEVRVAVDDGAAELASGTLSWSHSYDASTWSAGEHTLAATATDAAGNTATTSITVRVEDAATDGGGEELTNGDLTWTRERLQDPAFPGEDLTPLGQGTMAEAGDVSGVVYRDRWTGQRSIHLRNHELGTDRYLPLQTATDGWAAARYEMSSPSDLWVLGGLHTLTLRHFTLSGDDSGLPTVASLAREYTLEGSDSRVGDLVTLASGAVVPVWRELGDTQVLRVGYVHPDGTRAATLDLDFMPVYASKQVAAQHPADASVWVFGNADSYGALGAARLHEHDGVLVVDWTDPYFIDNNDGALNVDPENPRLAVAADAARGSLVLAYQSADRWRHSTDPWIVDSVVAMAEIATDGTRTLTASPVRAERISHLGLVVTPEARWLAYRPVDPDTLLYDEIHVIRYQADAWSAPAALGATLGDGTPVTYGLSRPQFALHLETGGLHRFDFA